MTSILNFHYDEKGDKLRPYLFEGSSNNNIECEFYLVLETPYDNVELPISERFPEKDMKKFNELI